MAIATKTKPRTTAHKRRVAQHHSHTKHYIKSYWPYLPIALLTIGCWQFGFTPWHHPAYGVAMASMLAFAVII